METTEKIVEAYCRYIKGWATIPKVILWDFRDLLQEIATTHDKTKTYFIYDTLRTLQLFSKALKETEKRK
jgi:hypothetical protein